MEKKENERCYTVSGTREALGAFWAFLFGAVFPQDRVKIVFSAVHCKNLQWEQNNI